MHTWTLVKIHEKNAQAAQDEVNEEFMNSCGDDKLFDYVSNCDVITLNDKEKKEFGVETFDELEAKYKAFTSSAMETNHRRIKEEMTHLLMAQYLKPEEAALHINSDNRRVQSVAQEILKTGGGKDLPKTLNELIEGVSDILVKSIGDYGNNLSYIMRDTENLQTSLDDAEDRYTAVQSSKNHFVDFTLDDESDNSLPLYYVIVDRHY